MADDHRTELVIAGTGGAPAALRTGCSGDADTVGAGLDEGSRVDRLAIGGGRCRGWTRVRAADGRVGWVHNSCLQPADEAPAAETDATADDPAAARLSDLRRLRDDGLITSEEFEDRAAPVEAVAPPGAWALAASEESEDRPASPPPAEVPPTQAPAPAAGGAVAARLRGYAGRLARAGAQPLGAAVEDYAGRVERVGRGDLPPSAGANPSALTPALIGDALGRNRLADIIEPVRNALIFFPVLWTWFEFGRASRNYRDYVDRLPEAAEADSFLVYWQGEGLEFTVIVAVALLAAIFALTLVLGLLRGAAGRQGTRAAREFAALLAEAEAVGAGQRADDPQEALAAFAAAGRELTDELRGASGSLGASVRPLADSVDVAREAMAGMSAAVERQQEQIGAIAASLAEVPLIAGRLAALETAFAGARDAARESAAALEGIRAGLDPRTEELSRAVDRVADLASRMERAASQIARATEDYGKSLAGFADGAAQLQRAAATMNEVAVRLREDR